jgi:hypothetical protein
MRYEVTPMAKITKKTTSKTAEPIAAKKKTAAKKAAVKKAAVKKPAATTKKTATKKATSKKAVAKKTAGKKAATRHITADDRRQMIAEAAFLRAEAQGFLSNEHEDWLLAEAEVDALLAKANIAISG